MKTLTVTTKTNKNLKIRVNEKNRCIHSSDYNKLNDDNFEETMVGDGFTDYKVGDFIVRKTYPTWINKGKCNILFEIE